MVTICAHVDHGKTTLADQLISSNGIISERAAGTLRYLDSDPEEQRRGITMRASAIGLQHSYDPTHARGGGNKHPPLPPLPKEDNTTNASTTATEKMIIHLVDSPGHSDFCREVSSSLVCCDAAIILVDAVEGVTARTQQVFRETAQHQLVPILLINKIDRLCTDLALTPTEAYLRLRTLLETINAAAAQMIIAARGVANIQEQNSNNSTEQVHDDWWIFEPAKQNVIFASALYGWGFTVPSLCRSLYRNKQVQVKPGILKNFLFGDYKLKKELNGSHTNDKILKWKQHQQHNEENNIPLFAELALQSIWTIYEGVAAAAAAVGLSVSKQNQDRQSLQSQQSSSRDIKIRADTPGMESVITALQFGSTASTHTTPLRNVADVQALLTKTAAGGSEETTLRAILRRYRPLADIVLDVICEFGPSPRTAASSSRSQALALREPKTSSTSDFFAHDEFRRIRQAVKDCSIAPDTPTVAYVCKFLSTDLLHVRDSGLENQNVTQGGEMNKNQNLILGMARVLSGHLRTGQEYFVFGPKFNAEDVTPTRRKIRLYLLMGSSFISVQEVPAGHLCALYGLEDVQLKTATISDNASCQPLRGFHEAVRPLVKVNIEPENTADAEFLERGLAKLSLADAAVEISTTDKGERILACLGELHLEQSILDLERIYCGKEGVKMRISDPIVDFAETTDWFPNNELENYVAFYDDRSPRLRHTMIPPYSEEEGIIFAKNGRVRSLVAGRGAAISIRVVPLVATVHKSLQIDEVEDEAELLKLGRALNCEGETAEQILSCLNHLLCSVDSNGNAIIESSGLRSGSCAVGVVAKEVHVPQVEFHSKEKRDADDTNEIEDDSNSSTLSCGEYEVLRSRIRDHVQGLESKSQSKAISGVDRTAHDIWLNIMKGSVVAGFQLATKSGPVCEEPMRNVLIVVEGVEVAVGQTEDNKYKESKPLSGGMVVSALRSGIRCALLSRPARLMEGHLRLTLHSSLAGIGSLYSVLSKRRGKVIQDSMVEGTDLLMITASIPQAEAFGLTPELFEKTSGEVTAPEMVFSHWERLDVDPFWVPTSEEEREDYGELQTTGDLSTGIDNPAIAYIRQIRKRKGLTVDSSRTVTNAEKQRTLKR